MSRTKWLAIGATPGAVLAALVVAWPFRAPARPPVSALLPTLAEVDFIEFDLNGAGFGRPNRRGCRAPREAHDSLLRFFTPSRSDRLAQQFLANFPPVGILRIHLKDGRTHRVVFVDGGMNPLPFSFDGLAYSRGGEKYPDYRKDHREFFGIDSETIDEAWGLADKLDGWCDSAPK